LGVLLLHLSGTEKEENAPQEAPDTINLTQPYIFKIIENFL